MSYTRTARKTKTISCPVDYPERKGGGRLTHYEKVEFEVNVHVDTNNYDASIENCNDHINFLTASVVTSKLAAIKSKRDNAFKVGKSLISGFFAYVRSEISQQISELKIQINSVILHLAHLRKGCEDKQMQMAGDFSRISSRYTKIFNDLDSEFTHRIYVLDAPTFNFVSLMKTIQKQSVENALLGTITVSANESSYLQSILYASSVKRRAQIVIKNANQFIFENLKQKRNFECVKFEGNQSSMRYIPLIFTESVNINGAESSNVFGINSIDMNLSTQTKKLIRENFSSNKLSWVELSEQNRSNLSVYFNNELDSNFAQASSHSERVKEKILSMWKTNKLNVLSNN